MNELGLSTISLHIDVIKEMAEKCILDIEQERAEAKKALLKRHTESIFWVGWTEEKIENLLKQGNLEYLAIRDMWFESYNLAKKIVGLIEFTRNTAPSSTHMSITINDFDALRR